MTRLPKSARPPGLRVALMVARLAIGGIERQFTQLAKGLLERGHPVDFTTLHGGGALEEDLVGLGVRVRALWAQRPRPGALALGYAPRLLAHRLREHPPDVLYTGDYVSNALGARAVPGLGIPLVWGIGNNGLGLPLKARLLRAWGRPVRARARLCVSNSHVGLENHRRLGYLPERSLVIPNGVDTDFFSPGESDLRRALHVPEGAALVGLVARLDERKDPEVFVRAAERLGETHRELHFVWAMPKVEELGRTLRRRIESCLVADRFHLWSAERDPRSIYRALDVFVSSSRAEGLPNTIVEALACGVPCVVTDVGDSGFAVGQNGTVVPPRNPTELARGIERILASTPREHADLARCARARAIDVFGLERFVDASVEALLSVREGDARR